MVKIFKSVGKNCSAECHDVAAVQMALKKAKFPQGGRCWYNGPVDGKKTLALEQAIAIFQEMNGLPVTARIEPTGPTRTALTKALNANWVGLQGIPGTTCLYVPGPYPGFDPIKQTEKSAPFPTPETIGLCKVMTKVQKGFGLTLTRKQDSISQDGRFMTLLAVEYDQFIDNASASLLPVGTIPTDAIKAIQKVVQSEATWNEGSPGTLGFSSKRQVEALKGAKEPSANFLKQTGLTKPSEPIINQLLAGAEKAAQTGKTQDAAILKDALKGADDKAAAKIDDSILSVNKGDKDTYKIYLVTLHSHINYSINGNTDYSVTGHTFIGGIDKNGDKIAYGFYPKERNYEALKLDHSNLQGVVGDDIEYFLAALEGQSAFQTMIYEVGNITFAKAIAFIKNYDKKYDYSLKSNNCVHAAFNALNYAGVLESYYFPIWASPNSVYHGIQKLTK